MPTICADIVKIKMAPNTDCVARTKTVVVKHTYEMVQQVPSFWTESDILFYFNDSSHCVNNEINELAKLDCVCFIHEASYVRDASKKDEENYNSLRKISKIENDLF